MSARRASGPALTLMRRRPLKHHRLYRYQLGDCPLLVFQLWCVSSWGFTCAFFIPFLVAQVLELGSRYAILCPRVKPTSIAKVFGLRPSYSFNTTAPDQLVIDCNYFMGSRQLPLTETLHNFGPVDDPPADFHHARGHWEARD